MIRNRRQLAALLMVAALASVASAGSIWAKGSRRTQAIYTDDTARNVGDILTIVIDEQTKIETETDRKLEKSSGRTASTSGSLDLGNIIADLGRYIFDFPRLLLDNSATTDFEGGADYDTDRTLADKISVVVEDVMPNGNLVVLGTRTRTVAGDTQVIQVSGIVRTSDVTFENEVSSERVADFRLVFKHEGQEEQFTNPGWLARALNVFNPF